MSLRLAAGVVAALALTAAPAYSQTLIPVAVNVTYGTMNLPGSSPAPYVAASSILPAEVLNDLGAAHSSLAPILVSLRDTGGPNTSLSNLFTTAQRPEAGFGALVAKSSCTVTDVLSPLQILRQAIVLGVPGTGTGQTISASSPAAPAGSLESYTYRNLPVTSGPPCPGCLFDGRVDVTLTRVDFFVTNPASRVTIPIVLSTTGMNSSFFTSELTITNRGTTDATILYSYTPVPGLGGAAGTATDTLAAGRQKTVADAIVFLKGAGIQVGDSGNRGGTLTIAFAGLSSPDAGTAIVRTTTAVAGGRAGLSYAGVLPSRLLSAPVMIPGLRQNQTDRSNVAVLNAGGPTEGSIALRITAFSGEKGNTFEHSLPDVILPPGGFNQISSILAADGVNLTNGYVVVERVAGTAPFYAYGVINDQANSDGSFVTPVPISSTSVISSLTLPVLVETPTFSTELVLTNYSNNLRGLRLTFYSSALSGGSASTLIKLEGGEQQILPNFIQTLRDRGAIVNAAGPVFAGPLVVLDTTGDLRSIGVGARTSSAGGGGRYGLFSTAVPSGSEATERAWIYGLQQNADNRTNLAIVNTGLAGTSADTFRIDIYDGATGQKATAVATEAILPGGFVQLNSILTSYAPGLQNAYAVVTRLTGSNPFLAYGVVNDGGTAGQRTGDGAFLPADVPGAP
ncbi:MAG: hypothetical protein PT977_10875 [Acidobacteriota bacterium]|nr:hypothetical protein [Acidobacteriota bacterium]